MRRIPATILAFAAVVSVSACASKRTETVDFFAMDTVMSITACGRDAAKATEDAEAEIFALEALWSVTKSGGEIYDYNAGTGELWSKDTDMLLVYADEIGSITDGAFDVRIYPVVEAWGFFSDDYRIPEAEELETLLNERDKLDFGGIAKGYASDRAAEIMKKLGIKSALVALGGNIYAVGNNPQGKPWRIAVQDPFDMSGYAGILSLSDEAAVTSGSYQRYFEYDGVIYHHIIDPRTGYPSASGLASVTVISISGTLADGLSTGLFVLGKERALEIWSGNRELFDLVLIEDDGEITITAGLNGRYESEYAFEVAW